MRRCAPPHFSGSPETIGEVKPQFGAVLEPLGPRPVGPTNVKKFETADDQIPTSFPTKFFFPS